MFFYNHRIIYRNAFQRGIEGINCWYLACLAEKKSAVALSSGINEDFSVQLPKAHCIREFEMVKYNFAILDPRNIPAAQAANDKIFSSECGVCLHSSGELDRQVCHECGGTGRVAIPVLGIEVTVPALASRCSLGNIDPQHDGSNSGLAAIEVALTCELPPAGATLVTVRPDMDAFGNMAIVAMRADGRFQTLCEDQNSQYEFDGRVSAIASADKARTDVWAPRDLSVVAVEEAAKAAPLAAIAAAVADFKLSAADRVAMVESWLLSGEEPAGYRDRYVANQLDAARAYESGAATVIVEDGIAVVTSTHRAATAVGYARAPVVVAVNPEFKGNDGKLPAHTKYTVCQYSTGHVDLVAALAELRVLEPGWGGSPTMVGSTQGESSPLSPDQVVSVVKAHLRK